MVSSMHAAALLLALCLLAGLAAAADFYVAVNGSDAASGAWGAPFATLSQAVATADDGDRILLHDGRYTASNNTGNFNVDVTSKRLTITSASARAAAVVVDCEGRAQTRVLHFGGGADCTLSHLTLRGGNHTQGGLVWLSSNAQLFVRDVVFADSVSTAFRGGGALKIAGTASVQCYDSVFRGNRAAAPNGSGGAILVDGGDLEAVNVHFRNQVSDGDGGAVYLLQSTHDAVFQDCTWRNNTSLQGQGGALYCWRSADVINNTFVENTAQFDGGAIYATVPLGTARLEVRDSALRGNRAVQGVGGAIASESLVDVRACALEDNSAGLDGGAVFLLNTLRNSGRFRRSTLLNNAAGRAGGAVYTQISAQLEDCVLSGNRAQGRGGAVASAHRPPTALALELTDCNVTANVAGGMGGGASADGGELWLMRTRLLGNTAGSGGAVAVSGSGFASVVESCVRNNTAATRAGALDVATGASATFAFAPVCGNAVRNGSYPNTFCGTGSCGGIVEAGALAPAAGHDCSAAADFAICLGQWPTPLPIGPADEGPAEADGAAVLAPLALLLAAALAVLL